MLPLSNSMRSNYAGGVDTYYKEHASTLYRNPHYPGILKSLSTFLDIYYDSLEALVAVDAGQDRRRRHWMVLDLAAGSGEVTEAIVTWKKRRQTRGRGVPEGIHLTATDPYTSPAYSKRTGGMECLELSFADIADGKLPPPRTSSLSSDSHESSSLSSPETYDLAICSFALHLITDPSQLWATLSVLSTQARYLVVLAPHKKPAIKAEWGWARVDPWNMALVDEGGGGKPDRVGGNKGDGWEIYEERVRLRVWKSLAIHDADPEDTVDQHA